MESRSNGIRAISVYPRRPSLSSSSSSVRVRHSAIQTILFQDFIEQLIGRSTAGEFRIVAVETFGAGGLKPACSSVFPRSRSLIQYQEWKRREKADSFCLWFSAVEC